MNEAKSNGETEISLEEFFTPRQITYASIRYYLILGLYPSQIRSVLDCQPAQITHAAKQLGLRPFKAGRPFGMEPRTRRLQEVLLKSNSSDWGAKTALSKAFGFTRQRLDQLLFRQKAQARAKLKRAVNNGQIIRPDFCDRCNSSRTPDAHHHDYSKPFHVQWLCKKCHGEITQRENPYRQLGPFARRMEMAAVLSEKGNGKSL